MRDSSLFKVLFFSSSLCLLTGVSGLVHAEEPIMLSNDMSAPAQAPRKPVVKKVAPPISIVPMAARPASQTGMVKPAAPAMARAGTVSPPLLDTPSMDEIEAALTPEMPEMAATPPVAPAQVAMQPVITPVAAVTAQTRQVGLKPVLRAAPPDFSDPLPASTMVAPLATAAAPTQPVQAQKPVQQIEYAPPTLRVSGEKFIPPAGGVINIQPAPQPNANVMRTMTITPSPNVAQGNVISPANLAALTPAAGTMADQQGVAVEPRAAIVDDGTRGSVSVLDMAPVSAPFEKPRLVVEGTKPMPIISAQASSIKWAPANAPKPAYIVDSFRARKGESLRDVLRRWAERAGIDLVWTMPTDITLEKDFSYVGKFETALNGLIAAYPESGLKTTFVAQGPAVDMAPKPYVAESAPPAIPPEPVATADLADFVPALPASAIEPSASNMVQPLTPMPMPTPVSLSSPLAVSPPLELGAAPRMIPPAPALVPAAPAQPVTFGPVGRWRALSGASMHQVLQAWAEAAGIPLVWATRDDFVVRYSVNNRTDYGRAVNELLGQYGFEQARPAGQIYRDPATGQTTLVVRSIRG